MRANEVLEGKARNSPDLGSSEISGLDVIDYNLKPDVTATPSAAQIAPSRDPRHAAIELG